MLCSDSSFFTELWNFRLPFSVFLYYHKQIQFCDIITGAVNASHNLILDQKYSINNGKRELIKEFASLLGWDDLCYDTYPNNILNIWQFPIEYRAYSGSKEICIIQ